MDSLYFRARANGVIPCSPLASIRAPDSNNTSVTSGFELFRAAWCSGALPRRFLASGSAPAVNKLFVTSAFELFQAA